MGKFTKRIEPKIHLIFEFILILDDSEQNVCSGNVFAIDVCY